MVHIQQLKDHELLVNDKLVVQNSNGDWIAKIELTQAETQALHKHVADIN